MFVYGFIVVIYYNTTAIRIEFPKEKVLPHVYTSHNLWKKLRDKIIVENSDLGIWNFSSRKINNNLKS